jgi:ABC-type phosphate transport system substrate-binding protein
VCTSCGVELDEHHFTLQLDVETVGRIYSGEITNWKHPGILVHNPGLQDVLPDHNILVVAHIGSGGENFIFKRYVLAGHCARIS